MTIIKAKNLYFRYDQQTVDLLSDVSLSIHSHSAIGLVGANGAGKSTLLKLITGELAPCSGMVSSQGLAVGYLSQVHIAAAASTAFDYLWRSKPALDRLRCALAAMEATSSVEQCQIYEDFAAAGGYEFPARVYEWLSKMQLSEALLEQPYLTLSGGEKTQIALLACMLDEPEVLFLDEPTNHLARDAVDWLQDFLARQERPYVVISHDRRILNDSVTEIWHLDQGRLRSFAGNYRSFLDSRKQEQSRLLAEHEIQQKKVKQLKLAAAKRRSEANRMERFKETRSIKNNGGLCKRDEGSGSGLAHPLKKMQAAMALENRSKRLIEREEAKKPFVPKHRAIILPVAKECHSRTLVKGEDLTISYGQRIVIAGLSIKIEPGERLAITGANGVGKTSLIKALAGIVKPRHGRISWSPSAVVSWFHQNLEDHHLVGNAIEAVWQPEQVDEHQARTVLGALGITGRQVYQPLATLSSGERARVGLAKTILSGANTLVMDEPSNHLALTAREMLAAALALYKGTVILVSHDEDFLAAVATRYLALSG